VPELNYVTGQALNKKVNYALITGMSEGGNCYALIIKNGT